MTKDEALKLALEYIETNAHERKHVRHAIQAALAQPAQEPVAWCWIGCKGWTEYGPTPHDTYPSKPLYAGTLPPQRPWVGLTDEERVAVLLDKDGKVLDYEDCAEAIEAKIKEKNNA